MRQHTPNLRRLFAMVDGRLSATEQLALRGHLDTCRTCAEKLAEIERTRAVLRQMAAHMPAPPEHDPNAEAKLMQAIERRGLPGFRVAWWWLPATAAATMAVALLILPTVRRPPPQEEPATVAAQPGAPAKGGSVATVLALRGQVQEGPSPEDLRPTRAGDELPGSRIVRTGPDGESRLGLVAGGELTLGPSSSMVLPDEPDGIVRLEVGTLDVLVTPRPEGRPPFRLETPLARIEAIATRFRVVHQAESTLVEVSEGKVRLVSLRSDAEELVVAGAAARADAEGRLAAGPAGQPLEVAVAPTPPEVARAPDAGTAADVEDAVAGEIATGAPVQVRRATGVIDPGKVRARVSRQRRALQACYSDYVMRVSPREVEARVRFVVLENGSVGQIDVNLSVDDRAFSECIERVFRGIAFPRPRGGPARVFYPVSFSL